MGHILMLWTDHLWWSYHKWMALNSHVSAPGVYWECNVIRLLNPHSEVHMMMIVLHSFSTVYVNAFYPTSWYRLFNWRPLWINKGQKGFLYMGHVALIFLWFTVMKITRVGSLTCQDCSRRLWTHCLIDFKAFIDWRKFQSCLGKFCIICVIL